jgi:epsin
MDMIDKRLNDKGKNWRHVLKALKVMDYCLHEGSELVVTWAKQNLFLIKTLREFQYIDEEGRDVGQNGACGRGRGIGTVAGLLTWPAQFVSLPRS